MTTPGDTDSALAMIEGGTRVVTALFESRGHAETARQDLIAAGIPGGAITLVADEGGGAEGAALGFWETVRDLFMPEDHQGRVADGLRGGGVNVAVRTDAADHDRVAALLDRDGAIDLSERRETGRLGDAPGSRAGGAGPALTFADDEDMGYSPPSDATAGFGASSADHLWMAADAAPPVESPGALPISVLEGAAEAASPDDGGGAVAGHVPGRPRVRSYALPSGGPIVPGRGPRPGAGNEP